MLSHLGNGGDKSGGLGISKVFNLGYGLQTVWSQEIYNGQSRWINCRGIGTCGTCALKIEGEVSEANWKDRARRALPPHSLDKDRRLACQAKVLGDIKIQKYDGFWGQGDTIIW